MGRTVSSPDGNRWYVRRVWLPWRPRWRRLDRFRDNLDVPDGCFLDALDDVLVVIAVVVVLVLFVLFVLPLLVTVIEVVLVLLLTLLGGVARVLFRRPWIVEATPATGGDRLRWKVVGWRRSGEVVDEAARQLEAGRRELLLPDVHPC